MQFAIHSPGQRPVIVAADETGQTQIAAGQASQRASEMIRRVDALIEKASQWGKTPCLKCERRDLPLRLNGLCGPCSLSGTTGPASLPVETRADTVRIVTPAHWRAQGASPIMDFQRF